MKLNKIAEPVVDLSDNPLISVVTKLKKNDIVIYEGEEWTVEFAPKKIRSGVWWIGLSNTHNKKYINIVEDVKPKMTDHEKKTMKRNISGVVEMFKDDPERLEKLVHSYYHNLAVLNNYDTSDVRECMSIFPIEILKKSKVIL